MEDASRDIEIEEQIRNMCDRTSDRMDQRILADLSGTLRKMETGRPVERPSARWRILMNSRRTKLAAVAAVALALMLPVSYGTVKAIQKYFRTEDSVSFQYPAPNDRGTTSYVFTRTLRGADGADPETTRAQFEEFFQLYREGKATEIAPGMWRATLANGKEFTFTGNPETDRGAAFTEEEKARLQQVTEEINELRQAGKGERTFWKETENNGMRIRLYNVRYTLSNGEVITLCEGEEAPRQ